MGRSLVLCLYRLASNSIAYEYIKALIASHRREQGLADLLWCDVFPDVTEDHRPAAVRVRAEAIEAAANLIVEALQ